MSVLTPSTAALIKRVATTTTPAAQAQLNALVMLAVRFSHQRSTKP